MANPNTNTAPGRINIPDAVIPGRQVDPQVNALYDVQGNRFFQVLRKLERDKANLGPFTLTSIAARQAFVWDGAKWVNGGSLTIKGLITAHRIVTATDAFSADDYMISADATTGAITLALPTAVGIEGTTYVAKKRDASGNAVTISAAGAELIDGAATKVLAAQYAFARLTSDNVGWELN